MSDTQQAVFFSSRHIFGSEPSNSEILDFYLNHFDKMKFINCSINDIKYASKKVSYKKSLHKGRKEMSSGSRPAVEIYNMDLSEYLRDKKEQQKEKEKTCREEKFNLKQKRGKIKKGATDVIDLNLSVKHSLIIIFSCNRLAERLYSLFE